MLELLVFCMSFLLALPIAITLVDAFITGRGFSMIDTLLQILDSFPGDFLNGNEKKNE